MDTTVIKAIDVIEALARSDRPRGITELAEQLELTKSNVHRLLQTLGSRGYLRRRDDGRYELSLRLWELGSLVLAKLDLKHVAYGHLQTLADLTRETVHLSVLDQRDVIYIDKIDSPEPVRAYSSLGGRAPAYCVATGKALLAFASDDVIRAAGASLIPYTSRTIRTEPALRQALAQIRQDGYATNSGEWRESVCGLAAPIRDASGVVIAAVGISGPADRLKPKRLKSLAPAVVATAGSISSDLGHAGARDDARTTAPRGSRNGSGRQKPV